MATKNIKAIYSATNSLIEKVHEELANQQSGEQKLSATAEKSLELIKESYKDIIEFLNTFLVRCDNPFYGNILMSLDITVDFKQRGAVNLKMRQTPYELSINPLFLKDITFPNFVGLITDEITKLIYLHPLAYSKSNSARDPKIHENLEKASSAASTSVVKRDIRIADKDGGVNLCRLPEGLFTTTSLNEQFKIRSSDDMPLEYYYDILSKLKDKDGNSNSNSPGMANFPLMGQGGAEGNSNEIATPQNGSGNQTHDWEGLDKDETKDCITSMVSEAYSSLSDKQRGTIPASVLQQIKVLLEPPEINWKQILRKLVGTVPVPHRKTKARLNRRQPYRADLSGHLPKRVVDVVCVFDTSGSMSDSDLKYCVNEVFNIIKVYEGYSVTIVECDAEVQRVYTARKMSEVQTKMAGRGGTCFTPAIEFLNGIGEYSNRKKWPLAGRYRNAIMIYFTDGYGERSIPKPMTHRNLWVVLKDEECLSVEEPYGEVKSIMSDEDYKKRH